MKLPQPLVSVIVPTRDSALFLSQCLESITKQTYQNIELIVVDNYSTDGTEKIARRFTDRFFLHGPERSAQRNLGVRRSEGEYVLIVDSDMVLAPRVVEECVAVVEETLEIKAVIIPEISVGLGFWAACKALERSCYIGDDTIEAARFFEKRTYLAAGGYDERTYAAEDWDLHWRLKQTGCKLARITALIEHQEGQLSLSDTIRTKYYYGKTIHVYLSKHPDLARQQLRLFRPAFRRHFTRLCGDPLHALGLVMMKVCEFAAGGAGYIAAGVRRVCS